MLQCKAFNNCYLFLHDSVQFIMYRNYYSQFHSILNDFRYLYGYDYVTPIGFRKKVKVKVRFNILYHPLSGSHTTDTIPSLAVGPVHARTNPTPQGAYNQSYQIWRHRVLSFIIYIQHCPARYPNHN